MENIKQQQKENIMIYGDHISFDKAGKTYKKLQKRYPNCNVHFYTNGMVYNDSNCDELDFVFDPVFYFYFVVLKKVNRLEIKEKQIWVSSHGEVLEPLEFLKTDQDIKEYLQRAESLDNALLCLKTICFSNFQKGLSVVSYQEYLNIIKQRFPLQEIALKRQQKTQKRAKIK